jgi:hypothetical protein
MENMAYYRAEIDYRREQIQRDRRLLRLWHRAKAAAPPKNHTR